MILVRWLARTWSALSTPPPAPLPGPRALPSYARMGRYIAGGAALDPRLDLLVRQLAAELSGCRWCIEHGLHRWRQAFLPAAELGALRRYAASPFFSVRERAALAFTEAVSRYTDRAGGIPGAVLGELRSHFSEQEVAALTLAVAGEHFFNPATGALGADARLATPGEPGVRRAGGSVQSSRVWGGAGCSSSISSRPSPTISGSRSGAACSGSARSRSRTPFMYCPTPSKPAKTFNGCGVKSWPEAARHPCARPRSWTAYRTDKSRRCSERSATPSMGSSRARPRRSRGGAGMGVNATRQDSWRASSAGSGRSRRSITSAHPGAARRRRR